MSSFNYNKCFINIYICWQKELDVSFYKLHSMSFRIYAQMRLKTLISICEFKTSLAVKNHCSYSRQCHKSIFTECLTLVHSGLSTLTGDARVRSM